MGVTRSALYDTAALAARIGVGGTVVCSILIPSAPPVLATQTEMLSLLPAEVARLLPSLAVASAAALGAGLVAPVAGTGLATLLLGMLLTGGEQLFVFSTMNRNILLLALFCLLLALNPGRLTLDRWILRTYHARTRSRTDGVRDASIKRPEHAPPLPYPESQVSIGRKPLL